MKITFAKSQMPKSDAAVVAVLEDRVLSPSAQALDEATGGALTRALKASRFTGKRGHGLTILAPAGSGLSRVFLLGLGAAKELDVKKAQAAGAQVWQRLAPTSRGTVSVMVDDLDGCDMDPAEVAAEMAFGARLRSYRFDKYLTRKNDHDKPVLKTLRFLCAGHNRAKARFETAEKVADGVFLTRDLVSEPANVLYPETLADAARKLTKLGVKVEVLGPGEMKKLGMGALLGVAQGSARDPRLVVMHWDGAGKGKKSKDGPLAFVGKGVTFDTGGISLKPAAGMEEMKWDMGGAGVVIGLMKALAGRKAKADVVGIVGLVENMPSGTAQRPGDVVTSMSGQTVEVINTDAEGRLVLADALWYCKERFKPRFMVDLATLTGAMIIALGHERAGIFTPDDDLAAQLSAAGDAVDEPVWRLPLGDAYDKALKSDIADMKNVGGRPAGSITAAQFLKRFVGETPWAHIDIAGVAWSKKDAALVPKGGTGYGVRLLDRMVADNYEK
ncbi:MAG: leucyl aminopeptidase [Hyphomicrobiales bacterium]|nr:leucyl aminopeptidase [Hyphomicrobiales bacterium]MCP5372543.1 leucyl aminopeptidase [Hyphomicrobiales bacterium]